MRNFKFYQHLQKVLLALIAFLVLSENNCQAIRLNANGGYDIVIGVEDSTPEPMNVNHFLDEIRLGVQQFSTELWKATHRRFFINSVDVLVPGNWWTLSLFDTATWQTLLGSEIRISHDVGAPNVVNPNTCGTSGLYIELPDDFFKVPRGGQFGPIGKALVNVWARYRFGVWEEHGIPGDTKFPYFYAEPSFEPRWEATGCSNEEITGSFRDIDGEISERCDAYDSESPDDNCRFIPSPSNTANSSLMHLHWLESVSEFCDSRTHNYVAPNKQNLFCGHRSVWEVIRESDDYKSTKTCMDSVPRPQFRVMKESRSPEFYILLDRGKTVTPERVLQEVMGALVQFVSYPTLERVNIAIGTYPHANQGKDHYYVKEEVGWAPISSVIYDIERVLGEASDPDGPVIRDFGLAIQEVAEKIKQRNHLAGTVILVIKRGASPNLFDKISFEQEVIASIKEDSQIKVFAIEAQQGEKTPYTNLQTLAEATSGQYHLINDTVNIAKKLEPILGKVQEKLEQSSIMNSLSSWTTQKQYTTPGNPVEIPIYDNVNVVKVHLTTHRGMIASDIYLEQVSGEHATVQFTEKGEWDENSDLSRRIVFTYTISNPTPGSVWSLRHGCNIEKESECRFFLVVTAHNDRPTPRVTDFSMFNSQFVTIDVSSSAAEHYYVDMSDQGLKVVPFAIYAKIEMEQQRVLGLRNVSALVRLGGEHNNHLGDWIVPLSDDGLGLPDVAENDGIYSGIFTPLEDGLYQISVHANGVSEPSGVSTFQDLRIVNHAGSLMQINQQSFGCKNSSKLRCTSAVPRGSFSRVQDMRRTVAVENAATFKPGKPTKILDFAVTALPNFNLEFEFTSPRLLGSDDDPEEFRIYMAPHVDNFIGSTDLTKLLVMQRGEASGSHVKIAFNAAAKAIPFYAVEAIYRGQKGGPSNVIGVVPSEGDPIVPSPTTTTSRPPITEPSTGPTSTTPYPWPSTTPTTESPFPTTTEESEETDEPIDPSSSTTPSTSTTEPSTISTTDASEITTISTTTENDYSSTSTAVPPTTTEGGEVTGTSSSTTEAPPSTTEDGGITGSSSSTTAAPPSTTEDGGITGSSSSTTAAPPSTTEDGGITGSSSSTTAGPTTTTEDGQVTSPSTTVTPPSTTEDGGVTESSSSTTVSSSTTTEDNGITGSTSSTTLSPSTTTENSGVTGSSSSTTLAPSTTTEDGELTSTSPSSTTASPSTTTDESGVTGSSSSTTALPSTTTEDSEITGTSTSTTLSPSTTTEDSEVTGTSSTTTQSPSSTTEDSGVTGPSSTTTILPSTTTEGGGVTEIPSSTTQTTTTTTDSAITSTSTSPSTSTTDPETSSSTTTPPASSSTVPTGSTSSTSAPSSSTPDEDVSNSPTTSTTTPEPSSSSLSTSEHASTASTPITETSTSASLKLASSKTLLSIITIIIVYFQMRLC